MIVSKKLPSRRPSDHPLFQQELKSYSFALNLQAFITIFFAIGLVFLPLGIYFYDNSNKSIEYINQYDGPSITSDCTISQSNVGQHCYINFTFTEDIEGPLYVYYELNGFYQNHRRYVKSLSSEQLMGENLEYSDVSGYCYPMNLNGSTLLNPCGLIANSMFNDVITLANDNIDLDTDGITWSFDTETKIQQVDSFTYKEVTNLTLTCEEILGSGYSNCKTYFDSKTNKTYYYYYPDDDSTQYLYETFPMVISPIEGVNNEHFVNWMRTAGLPQFRKYYGKIDRDFDKGDSLSFELELNYEVRSFGASKSLVVTNLTPVGSKSTSLGIIYLAFGSYSIFMGFLLAFYHLWKNKALPF